MINLNPQNLDISTLPSLSLKHAQSLPKIPGIYFCISNDKLLYIGITTDLNNRWLSHHKVIQLLNYENVLIHWLAIAPENVSPALERQFINYWEPLLNGRTHQAPKPLFSDKLYQLLSDQDLSGECWRILWGLTFWLEWDNWVTVSQRRFAIDMGIKPQNLSPILKILEQKGILERGMKTGVSYTFRFNPQILWKGDKSNLTVALHHLKSSPKSKP